MDAPGDSVDIRVRTRELWTTTLEFSYESFDGQAIWAAEIAERSVLGTGYGISLARSEDIDRDSWAVGAEAPQLLASVVASAAATVRMTFSGCLMTYCRGCCKPLETEHR